MFYALVLSPQLSQCLAAMSKANTTVCKWPGAEYLTLAGSPRLSQAVHAAFALGEQVRPRVHEQQWVYSTTTSQKWAAGHTGTTGHGLLTLGPTCRVKMAGLATSMVVRRYNWRELELFCA